MIAATPLVQDPRPTLVGERVNSQGSRKAKELLLADDYDGLADGRRGPGHRRRPRARRVRGADRAPGRGRADARARQADLAHPAGADPGRLDRARRDRDGARADPRAARSSTRSTSRPAATSSTASCRSPSAHGAALIALTIDEVGMAKTAERKLEIAQRITELCCDEHGLDPEALIFDCLTFTLDDRRRRVEARARSRRSRGSAAIKAEIPGVKTSLGVSQRLLRRRRCRRAACSTACSCTTASRRGSTWRWSTRTTSPPTPRSPSVERELADDLVFNRREDALERFIAHFESKGPDRGRGRAGRPDRGHGARGGAPLPHPAPQEGGRRGLDRPQRREDRRRPDAQRRAAAGDEGGRRQVRRRRADPAVRAPVGRGDEARGRPARAATSTRSRATRRGRS